jgi:hypothetical protein
MFLRLIHQVIADRIICRIRSKCLNEWLCVVLFAFKSMTNGKVEAVKKTYVCVREQTVKTLTQKAKVI